MRILDRNISRTLIEDKAVARIVNVEMIYEETKSFAITIELLNGPNAGILLRDDRFHVTIGGKYFWKLQSLMRAVNILEFDKNMDLEKAFLDKNLYVYLTIFRTENRFGKELKFQNFAYAECPYTEEQVSNFIKETREKLNNEMMNKVNGLIYKAHHNTIDNPFMDTATIQVVQPRKV